MIHVSFPEVLDVSVVASFFENFLWMYLQSEWSWNCSTENLMEIGRMFFPHTRRPWIFPSSYHLPHIRPTSYWLRCFAWVQLCLWWRRWWLLCWQISYFKITPNVNCSPQTRSCREQSQRKEQLLPWKRPPCTANNDSGVVGYIRKTGWHPRTM